jgi:ATP-dependent HslUV protease subunit HslV
VLAVRHQGKTVLASDGQVTLGQTVVKHQARKVRRLYHDKVLAGFAGSAADGFALFTRSSRSSKSIGQSRPCGRRACARLAHGPAAAPARGDDARRRRARHVSRLGHRRSHRARRRSAGDGSGGPFAMAAARALVGHSALDARAIVERAMAIAADICIYTNSRIVLEEL